MTLDRHDGSIGLDRYENPTRPVSKINSFNNVTIVIQDLVTFWVTVTWTRSETGKSQSVLGRLSSLARWVNILSQRIDNDIVSFCIITRKFYSNLVVFHWKVTVTIKSIWISISFRGTNIRIHWWIKKSRELTLNWLLFSQLGVNFLGFWLISQSWLLCYYYQNRKRIATATYSRTIRIILSIALLPTSSNLNYSYSNFSLFEVCILFLFACNFSCNYSI